jgi:hypothetical protein
MQHDRTRLCARVCLAVVAVMVCGSAEFARAETTGGSTLVNRALRAMDGAEEIVFAVRDLYEDPRPFATCGTYADQPGKFAHAPDGSQLCKLNLRTRQVTVLLDDPKGGVRDPRVHYDGGKVLFSYRKGGTHYYDLHEINTDGSGLKQLTSGEWDDIDPAYLPDGGIIFASTRCKRFVPCQRCQAVVLYRMDADGGNILCLSANNVNEDRPAVLPDGRMVYTRWEYVDRSAQKFRDLWVMNPDGTGQMVLFGGMARPMGDYHAKCDAMPIPGTDKLVSVFSPALGQRENAGNVMCVDVKAGPDDWSAAKQISPKLANLVWSSGLGHGREGFRDPYPLSNDCFLVAQDKSLLVLDASGKTEEFFKADKMVHDPRVIRSRPREPVIPSRIDLKKTTGQLVLANVYHGRNMEGVKPGTIKKLLVLEDLPKPVSIPFVRGAITAGGSHTVHRILGTVPVEPDGSASFEVPPLRGLFFVALDENELAVKRMQSYTMVMPGETQGCVGCHEARTQTISSNDGLATRMAMKRPPSRIEPIAGVPEVIDYPRDIQPIWDRHCVSCHSAEKPEGRMILTGDRNEWFTQSYYALIADKQVSDTRRIDEGGNNRPWGFGTAASPLMKKIDSSHYEAKLTPREHDLVRLWIESGAVFCGTYAVYNYMEDYGVSGSADHSTGIEKPLAPIIKKRCLTCHQSAMKLGKVARADDQLNDSPRYCVNLYNLSHPDKSMILLASLAKEAGGYAWCKAKGGKPTAAFPNANEPDYQTILKAIQAAKTRQEKIPRFDMPGFRPNEHYIRWMKRWGVLPESFDPAKASIDPYQTDQAYWRSLWHRPIGKRQGT